MAEVKKFISMKSTDPIPFEVDEDTFYLVPNAPGMAVLDVAAIGEAKGLDQARIIMAFLDHVLTPESAELFATRLSSAERPITIETGIEVATWALEVVTKSDRPTEAPSPSPNGSEATGTSSVDTASPETSPS